MSKTKRLVFILVAVVMAVCLTTAFSFALMMEEDKKPTEVIEPEIPDDPVPLLVKPYDPSTIIDPQTPLAYDAPYGLEEEMVPLAFGAVEDEPDEVTEEIEEIETPL